MEEGEEMEEKPQWHLPSSEGTSLQCLCFHIKASKVPSAVVSEAEDLPAAGKLSEVAACWLSFTVGCKGQAQLG